MKILNSIISISVVLSLFASSAMAADLRFWTTEHQPARMAKQKAMAEAFQSKTGVSVEVIPVEEKELGTRTTAAYAAGDLPDVIYHTLQYVLPWAEAGILDSESATDVVYDLGKKNLRIRCLENGRFWRGVRRGSRRWMDSDGGLSKRSFFSSRPSASNEL